jgi:hypothetical protein
MQSYLWVKRLQATHREGEGTQRAFTDMEETPWSPPPSTNYTLSGFSPSPQPPLPSVDIPPVPSQKTLHGYFHLPAKYAPHNPAAPPSHPQTLKRQQLQHDLLVAKKSRAQGTSKSALAEAKSRAEADKGVVDDQKFERFKKKIYKLDPHAEFLIDDNPRFVLHSKCARINKQKATYNMSNFAHHVQTCIGPSQKRVHIANTDKKCFTNFIAGNIHSLPTSQTTRSHPDVDFPCPGLTPEYDSRIATYLTRSQAAGGGSRPRHVISQEEFTKPLGDLDKDEFTRVCRPEATEFRWINFREQQFVCAATCLKKSPSRQKPAVPCGACMAVAKDPIFKNALGRRLPKDENLKFTPRGHRAKLTGEQYTKMVGVYDLVCKASNVSRFQSVHRYDVP